MLGRLGVGCSRSTKTWKGSSLICVSEDLSWNWGRAGSQELQVAGRLWTCVLSPTNLLTTLCVPKNPGHASSAVVILIEMNERNFFMANHFLTLRPPLR